MNRLFLLLIISTLLLSSCVENKYLEKLGLITAVGYDEGNGEKIKGTLVLYQFNPAMDDVEKILTSSAKTTKGILLSQNLETDHTLVSGQLRIAVYGRELAENGIAPLVDTLVRDSSIGNMVYLAIADTSAEEILSFPMEEKTSNMGTYLYNLVRQNVESELLVTPTLQEFITDYGSVGKDPILPLFKASDGKVGVEGFALFKEDKFIKELDKDKIFYIRSLMEDFKAGTIEIELPLEKFKPFLTNSHSGEEEESVYIMIDSIKSFYKIKDKAKDIPEFNVELNMKARLLEMSEEMNLSDPKTLRFLEKEIGQYIEDRMKETIKMLQSEGTDPIGFGMVYKSKRGHEKISREKWKDIYKQASFNVKVKNTIIRTGVID
ncbi:Ger(x)C family spore germination protein (plasmid) [Cytobacillus spongiae]|uniref:Ger(x)C family spore germination protein n=1 Tax=Cytobacillus spongiae TaxID=2901381 RepID=UPI001CD2245E|nr:Ger(x)C family spore germination protein [Cytobacillus spongiae]MCA1062911.1 Ger(x)C family spore germination protein [Rossellomorea aquimaris]UII58516.1 Ger(x)C family spore germination protein [Cytobacillus spongiae]WJV28461.1 Ger(x)C family spore germination protein [Rossellomorea sp. AcN35-11]